MKGIKHSRCGGLWEPLQHWSSKYRCTKCGVLGLRNRHISTERRAGNEDKIILEVRCSIHGCSNAASIQQGNLCLDCHKRLSRGSSTVEKGSSVLYKILNEDGFVEEKLFIVENLILEEQSSYSKAKLAGRTTPVRLELLKVFTE